MPVGLIATGRASKPFDVVPLSTVSTTSAADPAVPKMIVKERNERESRWVRVTVGADAMEFFEEKARAEHGSGGFTWGSGETVYCGPVPGYGDRCFLVEVE